MTEAKKLGTDQIIKVLDVIIEIGNVSEKVGQASTIITKCMAMLPITDELLRLISLSPKILKAQYKDLDDLEKEELQNHIKKKFDIEDDDLEEKLENGLELVGEGVAFIERAVDYAKSFKKKD